jgi:hypothetical protein
LRFQQRPGRRAYRLIVFDDKNLTLFDSNHHTLRQPPRRPKTKRGEFLSKYVLVRNLVLNAAAATRCRHERCHIGGILHRTLTPHKPQADAMLAPPPRMLILCV